jgi:uncharacterized protein (DUF2252 family)
MDIIAATHSYESWLAGLTPLYAPDLDYKHRQMADASNPFPFFRGTYYRWVQLWHTAAAGLMEAPTVLAIGDLHVENFGTWRDADGRLCWGINDFDEVDYLPYTVDLVRLAASVRFARAAGLLAIKTGEASQAILAGYGKTLQAGGMPFVLEEKHRRLRSLAMQADRDPTRFWKRLNKELIDPVPEPCVEVKTALVRELPAKDLSPQFYFRAQAGMGSLGKPRYVALAGWNGSWVAREAKVATPPATAWARGFLPPGTLAAEAVGRAMRCPDPSYQVASGWVFRRLGPRCSRIHLDHLQHARDLPRLLRAMGAETANIHLGTATAAAAILADLAARPRGWLVEAVRTISRAMEHDWAAWRKASSQRT